jgi:hypothetical protein
MNVRHVVLPVVAEIHQNKYPAEHADGMTVSLQQL